MKFTAVAIATFLALPTALAQLTGTFTVTKIVHTTIPDPPYITDITTTVVWTVNSEPTPV
ncbi:hypothetical protein CPC08DRAFT_764021 [Agrocybe pediades]|nr:hypothetical protein CPC08DRAFT_764021 [Agrocybe pediades]